MKRSEIAAVLFCALKYRETDADCKNLFILLFRQTRPLNCALAAFLAGMV